LRPESIAVMKQWLFENLDHPYPSDDEKRDMASRGGIQVTQVNYWVITIHTSAYREKLAVRESAYFNH
jgi:hypothetical protein